MPFEGVSTTTLLVRGMQLAQDNHRIIANNIANADTPGYNPVKLDFEATLRNAVQGRGRISLRKTRPRHLESLRFRPVSDRLVFASKNDFNKVDIEEEVANLSENTGRYNVYASIIANQFEQMKTMITNAR